MRPVCLPFKNPNLEELSDRSLYRLHSNNSKISQPTGYNMMKYMIVSNEKCSAYNIPLDNPAFCAQAQGNVQTGIQGDPFMHAYHENGKFPIYQVALGAYQMSQLPAVFINVHQYIGWINDTINGNIGKTRNEVVLPLLREHEKEFSFH